jgi:phage terminase large subunit GpA-like protein
VSKHQVRHFWSCENCGHEFQMSINVLGYREETYRM